MEIGTKPEATAVDVLSWLRNLGLERYEAAFRENDVGADVLRDLTAEDLEGLGVAHRPSASTVGLTYFGWPAAHEEDAEPPAVTNATIYSLRF
jgi:hypothetical protein